MKQVSMFPLFMLFLLSMIFSTSVSAQISFASANSEYGLSYKKKKDEYKLKDHLWFGGGFTLGFAGTNNASIFALGVSPMAGYKIWGPISVGPRISVLYTSQKIQGIKADNLFDIELSLFLRVRVFKGLFFQGELGTVSDQYAYQISPTMTEKFTRTRPAQHVGLGYNFSNGEGGVGQEIAILYDFYVASDINSYEQPWQYRIAFTYGF